MAAGFQLGQLLTPYGLLIATAVVGTNMQNETYEGTLAIDASEDTYQLVWETDVGNFTGTGILIDTYLSVVYGQPGASDSRGLPIAGV